MNTTRRRSQTPRPSFLEVVSLPVSAGSLSWGHERDSSTPYSRMIALARPGEIGTGRDTINILDVMKAILLSYTYVAGPTVAALVGFESGTGYVDEVALPFTGYNFDTGDLTAETISVILAYAATNSYSMTAADIIGIGMATLPRSETTLSLSVQTSTGAVGTQISAAQDSLVFVNPNVSTTANIAGNASLDLVVEVAPTNSATAGDWVEKARFGQSQSLTLAIALQSVQNNKGELVVFCPKGYYVKLRSLTATGTTSSGISSSRAVLL